MTPLIPVGLPGPPRAHGPVSTPAFPTVCLYFTLMPSAKILEARTFPSILGGKWQLTPSSL